VLPATGASGAPRHRADREPERSDRRPGAMSRLPAIALLMTSAILLGACATGAALPASTAIPSPSASSSVVPSPAIGHAAGAGDVILRMSTGGGLLAPGALLSEIPEFSLYGDGTVVYRDPATAYEASSRPDGISLRTPFQTARLPESQLQELLAFAIGPGGLGTAQDTYPAVGIADAPSTTFTIRTDALTKEILVGALGMGEPGTGPDAEARAAFEALAAKLHSPDLDGVTSHDYAPPAYRGILFQGDGGSSSTARPWPWTSFGPDDFRALPQAGPMATPVRMLTADDVALLGIPGVEGGADGIGLRTTNGRTFLLSLRPLLPDEKG